MPSVHDPVRGPDESLPEYRDRMRRSRALAKAEAARSSYQSVKSGAARSRKANRPAKGAGQSPKAKPERKRKPTKPTGVTLVGKPKRPWREREPVHVVKPIRAHRLAEKKK